MSEEIAADLEQDQPAGQLELHFQKDVYCVTFLQFIQSNDALLHRELMLKSALTFSFQMVIIYLIRAEKRFHIFEGSVALNIARVLCSFILHVTIMPEVNCSVKLMKFVINNPTGFYGKQSMFPFSVALMKFIAGIMTEVCNMLVIVQSSNIENAIKDFIAFGFICELDDLVVQTVNVIDCEDALDRAGIGFDKKMMTKTFG